MPTTNPKLLFIVKERYVYGTKTKSYGLINSCNFVVKKLNANGINAEAVQVVDNNSIDFHVSRYQPTHCFIEALWVVPSKFLELSRLHPDVEWIVRLHSMIPFLSNEGMAFEWINEYIELRKAGVKISISCNNEDLYNDLKPIYKYVSYSPNIYVEDYNPSSESFDFSGTDTINIGCFGALRPLKNNTKQAMAAIKFADGLKKKLNFHVNISEHEKTVSSPILKNLRHIFAITKHKLIEHPWYEHHDFLQLVRAMDFGMQVSFTESFNITAADFVHCQIPVVVSKEIQFVHDACRSDVHDDRRIMQAMENAYYKSNFDGRSFNPNFSLLQENNGLLQNHNNKAIKAWYKLLGF